MTRRNAFFRFLLLGAILGACEPLAGPDDAPPDDAATDPPAPGWRFERLPPLELGAPFEPVDPLPSDAGEPAPRADAGHDAGAAPEVGDGGGRAPGEDAGAPRPPPGGLGLLPPELAALAWPARPRIAREVTVRTIEELRAEAAVAATRIHVRGAVGGEVTIRAGDVEVLADDATRLGRLHVARGLARVRVEGGRWAGVTIAIPAVFVPSVEYRPEWMAQDLHFERMIIDSGDESAFEIRGRRIAIVQTVVTAGRYSVWCGDTASFQSEDVILLENDFDSAGPEATVRLVSVLRAATVANRLTNGAKHDYRVHGESDLAYAARNLLVNTGVMLGTMPGDDLGLVWFDENVFHHDVPDLFNPSPAAIRALRARDNVAYTDVWDTFYAGAVPAGWELVGNEVRPYAPPPPR